MFSWFPILFPLKEPLQLKQGDLLTLHFWRLVSKESHPFLFKLNNIQKTKDLILCRNDIFLII